MSDETTSMFETGRGQLELLVEGPRGALKYQRFEFHPLTLAIPLMTQAECETLRASIERDGVVVPIEIYDEKILDGRYRAYFASLFRKPVRVNIFEGTEEEARQHVVTLNGCRSHFSPVQRAAIIGSPFPPLKD